MIGAYGHDDRVDAYPALMAEIGITAPAYTTICVLTDKEETGSDGVTGLNSICLLYTSYTCGKCFCHLITSSYFVFSILLYTAKTEVTRWQIGFV